MRAIVLDCKGGRAALLLEDGTTTYRRMRVSPGQYVEVPDTDGITRMTGVMRTVAAMLVLVLGLGSYYTNIVMEYSYVSVDVNPSIEFSLNRFDRIVNVEALNKDAGVIVEDLNEKDISGRTLYEAMELTVESLIEEGYMDTDEAYMLLDVASRNNKRGAKISRMLNSFLKDQKEAANVKYALVESSLRERDEAKNLNISSGRYEKMIEAYGPRDVSSSAVEEYQQKPVKELVDPFASDALTAENAKDKKEPPADKAKPEDKKKDEAKSAEPAKAEATASIGSGSGSQSAVSTEPASDMGGTEAAPASEDTGSGNTGDSGKGKNNKNNDSSSNEDDEIDDADDFDASEDAFDADSETYDDDEEDPAPEEDPSQEPEEDPNEEKPAQEVGQGESGPAENYDTK